MFKKPSLNVSTEGLLTALSNAPRLSCCILQGVGDTQQIILIADDKIPDTTVGEAYNEAINGNGNIVVDGNETESLNGTTTLGTGRFICDYVFQLNVHE